MATNQVQAGDRITITAGAAYDSGDVVVVGANGDASIGIAATDIASGAVGELIVEGVFTVPKVSAAVITQGETVIWDSSASAFDDNAATPASGDVSLACTAWEDAAATTTTVKVKLNTSKGVLA